MIMIIHTRQICDHELANTYFHCAGCEKLVLKEYNICDECFTDERFKCTTAMNDDKLFDWASNLHHIGKVPKKRCKACVPKKRCKSCHHKIDFPKCEICTKCTLCSSHCHWNFSKRAQFFNQKDQIELKVNCEDLVGEDEVQFAKETEWRLGNRRLGQWVCKADKADLPLCYDLTPIDDNGVHEV